MPSPTPRPSLRSLLLSRRMGACLVLGFASGLPLYVLISMLPAWMRTEGFGLHQIGALATAKLPYTWKFLWSPLLDRFALPWLGRRRDWIAASQVILIALFGVLALRSGSPQGGELMLIGWCLAAAGATQDIALDAYRRELLPDRELALGNAVWVNAYRGAGFVAGGLALILADATSWAVSFAMVAACMAVTLAATVLAPAVRAPAGQPVTLEQAIIGPFRDFFSQGRARKTVTMLGFLLLYKLGDTLATALLTPFYLDLGFSLTEIGAVVKSVALVSLLAGGLLGGLVIARIGINRSLWIFGLVQMMTIPGFALLDDVGKNAWMLRAVVFGEHFGIGLGTAAFVAFVARATSREFSATQYALLSSLVALPSVFAGLIAARLIEQLGYAGFFLLCTALALPGMLMLPWVAPWQTREESD